MTNPVGCHLNGGVNLATVDDVFATVGTTLRGRLRRITDGEVDEDRQQAVGADEPTRGSRQQWIFFLVPAYDRADGIVANPDAELAGDAFPSYRLTGDAEDIDFGDGGLGYFDVYADSYRRFVQAKDRGDIDPHVRFQVQFPTATAIGFFLQPGDRERAVPRLEEILADEIDEFLGRVNPDEVAVQLDVAVETGLILGWYGPKVSLEALADQLASQLRMIDHSVPVGLHLCYGDYRHHHLGAVESLEMQVRLINAVNARVGGRSINWYAITVPQDQTRPEFFAALADLRLRPETEIYFGIVPYHPAKQEPGTTQKQIDLINRFVTSAHGAGASRGKPVQWGVCTECGMARVEREDIDTLLQIHAELSDPLPEAVPT